MPDTAISFFSKDKQDLEAITRRIDPDLKFVQDLHPDATSCRTLLVDQDGEKRILKVRRISQNMWDDTYFHFEIDALRRVDERKLTNVTHMVKYYKDDEYEAVLKTYAQGTPCNRLDIDKLLLDPDFIKRLDALYLKLHLAGIAKINFLPRKIVVSEDSELTLVDLSTCLVNTSYGVQRYAQEMKEDSNFITRLERRARKAARKASRPRVA
jgi:hypothetical protein